MSFAYLASPYSHPDPKVRLHRYNAAMECVAWLLEKRRWVYSPIVHCHELGLRHALPYQHDFWRDYDQAMIRASNFVLVLRIEGTDQSRGVEEEIIFALDIGRQVQWIEPDDEYGYRLSAYI